MASSQATVADEVKALARLVRPQSQNESIYDLGESLFVILAEGYQFDFFDRLNLISRSKYSILREKFERSYVYSNQGGYPKPITLMETFITSFRLGKIIGLSGSDIDILDAKNLLYKVGAKDKLAEQAILVPLITYLTSESFIFSGVLNTELQLKLIFASYLPETDKKILESDLSLVELKILTDAGVVDQIGVQRGYFNYHVDLGKNYSEGYLSDESVPSDRDITDVPLPKRLSEWFSQRENFSVGQRKAAELTLEYRKLCETNEDFYILDEEAFIQNQSFVLNLFKRIRNLPAFEDICNFSVDYFNLPGYYTGDSFKSIDILNTLTYLENVVILGYERSQKEVLDLSITALIETMDLLKAAYNLRD